MKINAGGNVKNWLIKVIVIKYLLGILVIVSVNVIKSCDIGEYLDYENCKCRKKLVNKLVEEECTENIDKLKLAKMTLAEHENVCKCSCTLYIALFSVLFTINIGIGTFLFNTNIWIMIKKQLLKKVLSFKQQFTEHIKMTVKSINIKNHTYYFFNDMIDLKYFDSNLLKLDKESETCMWHDKNIQPNARYI